MKEFIQKHKLFSFYTALMLVIVLLLSLHHGLLRAMLSHRI